MEYLYFQEEFLDQYDLNGTLLNHSRISQNNRARLFSWLSEECSKQKISRFTYSLTCAYMDLYFMKKNDVYLKDYQLLALGALILAAKQVQIEGKIPIIDLNLFRADQLLNMEKDIVFGLKFYLNPPIYIELLNNIAKFWDIKCEAGQVSSTIRYLQENKDSYIRMKTLYEKMDCLILFKKILDFDVNQVVVTLFYLQTRKIDEKLNSQENNAPPQIIFWSDKPDQQDFFQRKFINFLIKAQITTKPSRSIEQILRKLTADKFPINEDLPKEGLKRTFTQLLSIQTYNRNGIQIHKQNHSQISRL